MTLKEGIPRHTQITQWLVEQIEKGAYQPDEKLPSENDLCGYKTINAFLVTLSRTYVN